jgi:hypothetical protein
MLHSLHPLQKVGSGSGASNPGLAFVEHRRLIMWIGGSIGRSGNRPSSGKVMGNVEDVEVAKFVEQ